MRNWTCLCFLLLFPTACWDRGQDVNFRIVVDRAEARKPARIRVIASRDGFFQSRAIEHQPHRIFKFTVGGESVPVAGRLRVEGSALVFESAFGLVAGTTYRAEFRPSALTDSERPPIISAFQVPAHKAGSTARVVAIYPSVNLLPCNQLKFYVLFSQPMRQGEVFEHVRILNARGDAVAEPFREVELWNETNTRLTLYIHPGRIKRGVSLKEEMGPVLEPQKEYSLVIDKGLKDAAGNPMVSEHRKAFRTISPDRLQPNIRRWKVTEPEASTRGLLILHFGEPLDFALLNRMIRIERTDGTKISGKTRLEKHESAWKFQPSSPWTAGDYRVVVDSLLEDLAGNSLRKPFEVDTRKATVKVPPELALKFKVKTA